jgi:hypothetical protein
MKMHWQCVKIKYGEFIDFLLNDFVSPNAKFRVYRTLIYRKLFRTNIFRRNLCFLRENKSVLRGI